MVVAIIYASLPMEDISEYLFPVVNNEEVKYINKFLFIECTIRLR